MNNNITPPRRKCYKKTCAHPKYYCSSKEKRGGYCQAHMRESNVEEYWCKVEGCTNKDEQGGQRRFHGAVVKGKTWKSKKNK